jgi:hypothetical protein
MKERSKERYSELMMEELLDHLSRNENVKKMLGEMISMPVLDLIAMLVKDFEKIVEQRSRQSTDSLVDSVKKMRTLPQDVENLLESPSSGVRSRAESDGSTGPSADSSTDIPFSTKVSHPGISSRQQPTSGEREQFGVGDMPQVETSDEFRGEVKDVHPGRNVEAPTGAASEKILADEDADGDIENHHEDLTGPDSHHQKHKSLRIPNNFADEDMVYVHAVTRVPEGESSERMPFMLEEKGIDQRNFAFAFDFDGLRFYLSKIIPTQMNVSKTGVLLQGKQESMQLRGVHENILNDLRIHGVLLPFAFGTVARNKADFLEKIDSHIANLRDAVDELTATTWWTLSIFVLDSRIAQLFGENKAFAGRPRERERESYTTPAPSKKLDIVVLERMLQKEKKIAEVVHKTLSTIADRSDIDMMVGLESGASEDWKIILKASYEVPAGKLHAFNRAVTELQYDHILFDLMLSVEGNREAYSF